MLPVNSHLTRYPTCAGDGNVNGFGLEFFIETPGDEIADTIHDVKKSWQFQLLYTVSQLAAGAGCLGSWHAQQCAALSSGEGDPTWLATS